MSIGKNVWISPDVIIDPLYPERIKIQDGVFLGWGVRLFTHMVNPKEMTGVYSMEVRNLVIKRNTLVGGFSTIRGGVTVGEGCVVGSDSLVVKDVPDGEVWAGVPSRFIRKVGE